MNKILITILVLSCFPKVTKAQETSQVAIVISQLQVSGDAGANDEFIEIRNVSAEPQTLSGWSVQYKSATGNFPLSAKKNLPEITLPPGHYYLIANNSYNGTVMPDLLHSSFNMSGAENGATIFLAETSEAIASDTDPNITYLVTYGSGSNPVPSAEQSLYFQDHNAYQIVNSNPHNLEYQEENNGLEEQDNQTENQEEVGSENENNENESTQAETEQTVFSSKLVISEFMPNPQGADGEREWVELFNSSAESIDLGGWILDDSGSAIGSSAYKISNSSVAPNSYIIVTIPAGRFALNNSSSDSLRLFWPNLEKLSEISYSAPAKEEQSWCKINGNFTWCRPTPNQENAELITDTENEEEDEEEEIDNAIDFSTYTIKIIEILPDPQGADAGNETVRLVNNGTQVAELKGWILDDGFGAEKIGGTAFKLEGGSLDPGEETEIIIPKGRFALNNSSSDGARLFSPDENLHDFVVYEKAQEGAWYSSALGGEWAWVGIDTEKTPGQTGGQVKAARLPRSGLPLDLWAFVFLFFICYIVCGLKSKVTLCVMTRLGQKGTYEQTRSD